MQQSSVSKGEKSPWTRARRCLSYSMLFLMVGTFILVIFYISSAHVCQPPNFQMRSSVLSQSYNDMNATVGSRKEEGEKEEREQKWTETEREVSPAPSSSTSSTSSTSLSSSSSEFFVAYPHHYNFILDEPIRCREESPFVVLMVPVAPHNREARDVIRNTWGKEVTVLGRAVSYYFLLGRSKEEDGAEPLKEQVLQESETHHDILQSSFLDSYNNLTIKTMVMFEWLTSHCPRTSYGMKVDSDIFLNVHNLVEMLLKAPEHLYMTGLVVSGAVVVRNNNSKWFLPPSAFPEPVYPPYALGFGYVFSLDLAKKILEAPAHVKAVYIEDVYVGLCMRHLGIKMANPPRGGLFRATWADLTRNCSFTSVITAVLQNSKHLLDVWKTYQIQVQSGC